MSIGLAIKDFFSTSAETRDEHHRPELKSRYYKCANMQAITAVQEVVHSFPGIEIEGTSVEHGEIAVRMTGNKKGTVIITVISVRPFEAAIDLNVCTDTVFPSDFGYSRRFVASFYNALDKKLTKVK